MFSNKSNLLVNELFLEIVNEIYLQVNTNIFIDYWFFILFYENKLHIIINQLLALIQRN